MKMGGWKADLRDARFLCGEGYKSALKERLAWRHEFHGRRLMMRKIILLMAIMTLPLFFAHLVLG